MMITKRFHFYAAHRNPEIGGKCANLHGHTYRVDLSVFPAMCPDDLSGVTIPFDDLDVFGGWIRDHLDHGTLVGEIDGDLLAACVRLGSKHRIVPGPASSVETVAVMLLDVAASLFEGRIGGLEITVAETESSAITVRKVIE
jgi:6-pyruvoyltetrahydropterin/6-carboxytetrahydropterin synthase